MKLPLELEHRYIASTPITHRKKFGQFFTPEPIAALLRQWVEAISPATVLDPAVGTGKLLTGFSEETMVTGYDIDGDLIDQATAAFESRSSLQLHESDFLTSDWNARYEGIVCNPPYIKFKSYPKKRAYFRLFKEKMKLDLSGYTNMYVLFLLKGLHQLEKNGRAAFIVPTEFLNASYGEPVRKLLASKGNLTTAAVTDFTLSWFDDAATTSTLLFIDNTHGGKDTTFFHLKDEAELAELASFLNGKSAVPMERKNVTASRLASSPKWQSFYQHEQDISTYALKPLASFTNVHRGIATGANDYFCLSKNGRLDWQLESNLLLPCVSRANQIRTPFFSESMWEKLHQDNAPVLLLNAKEDKEKSAALKAYLAYGEAKGVDQKYLTKRRRVWYKQESRAPAPILAKTLFRDNPVFIRNQSGAVNLTAFHCIYPLPAYRQDVDVLMAYLLTDLSRKILARFHKQYGRGLKKFEPGDLKNALVADLDALTEADKQEVLVEYEEVKRACHETGIVDASRLDELFERMLVKV